MCARISTDPSPRLVDCRGVDEARTVSAFGTILCVSLLSADFLFVSVADLRYCPRKEASGAFVSTCWWVAAASELAAADGRGFTFLLILRARINFGWPGPAVDFGVSVISLDGIGGNCLL